MRVPVTEGKRILQIQQKVFYALDVIRRKVHIRVPEIQMRYRVIFLAAVYIVSSLVRIGNNGQAILNNFHRNDNFDPIPHDNEYI